MAKREVAEPLPTHATPHGRAVLVPSRGLIVVSWSEIDTVRQCPMKHDLSYVERWTKPPRADGALAKGTLWHAVLEAHYGVLQATQGARPGDKPTESDKDRLAQANLAAFKVLSDATEAGRNDPAALSTVELVAWMYQGYLNYWGGLDPDWWIAATEHSAQVRLPTPTGGKSRFVLKLKIDLVIAMRSGILADGPKWRTYVVDHKSGKDLPKDKDFDFLDQFSLYTWALNRMGKSVFGQMYNAARTFRGVNEDTKPVALDTRFSRTPMHRTDIELDRVAIEAYQTIRERYRQQLECDRAGTEPPRYTNEGTCSWRCVPEGTLVEGHPFGASRRRYSGRIVSIETKGGRKLTVTPEHPILTAKGWIRAGLLTEGQYVVGDTGTKAGAHPFVGSDVQYSPVPIEQIFDTLGDAGRFQRVESGSVQFYGDRPDTEVEVVWADCVLSIELITQPRRQLVLAGSNDRLIDGPPQSVGHRLLVERTYSDSVQDQVLVDRNAMHPVITGECGHRLAGSVITDHGGHIKTGRLGLAIGNTPDSVGIRERFDRERVIPQPSLVLQPRGGRQRTQFYSGCDEPLTQRPVGVSTVATDGTQGPALLVEADEIVSVHRTSYDGWVFDLSTRDGWFAAGDGIITHNCDFTEPCLHGRKGGDMRDFLRSTGFVQDFTRH